MARPSSSSPLSPRSLLLLLRRTIASSPSHPAPSPRNPTPPLPRPLFSCNYSNGVAVTRLLLQSKCYFHSTGLRNAVERGYYEILGISKDATQDEVKKAFHALAKRYHPDANKNNPAAKKRFQEIREAYETLRDSEKRAQYDQINFAEHEYSESYASDNFGAYRSTNQEPFSNAFYHIFSEVFENDRDKFAPDVQVELSLSFHEAAKGCRKHLSFKANVLCDSCYGSGQKNSSKLKTCPTCRGTGKVTIFPFTSTCSSCRGLGKVIKDYCSACGGYGVMEGTKEVDVTIPPGLDSGDVINVPKAGHSGGRGAHPGNLHIKLHVDKDPIFSREGADIFVDSQISFTQAILGGRIEVPTLNGKMQVQIPTGVQPGQCLALKGKGLPKHVGRMDYGDQVIRIRVLFPTSVNERQRTLLEEFAKEEEAFDKMNFSAGNWWKQITGWFAERSFVPEILILLAIMFFLSKSVSH